MITKKYKLGGVNIIDNKTEEKDQSTEEQRNNWLSVCNGCEHYFDGVCDQCGCLVLNIMSLKQSSCPIDKW
jgi:hypothetical protein